METYCLLVVLIVCMKYCNSIRTGIVVVSTGIHNIRGLAKQKVMNATTLESINNNAGAAIQVLLIGRNHQTTNVVGINGLGQEFLKFP